MAEEEDPHLMLAVAEEVLRRVTPTATPAAAAQGLGLGGHPLFVSEQWRVAIPLCALFFFSSLEAYLIRVKIIKKKL